MTDPDTGPASAAIGPPRRPGLARLLRAALPASRRDAAASLAVYAAFTVALHAVLHFTWLTALLASVATEATAIVAAVAIGYTAARRQPGPGEDGR